MDKSTIDTLLQSQYFISGLGAGTIIGFIDSHRKKVQTLNNNTTTLSEKGKLAYATILDTLLTATDSIIGTHIMPGTENLPIMAGAHLEAIAGLYVGFHAGHGAYKLGNRITSYVSGNHGKQGLND